MGSVWRYDTTTFGGHFHEILMGFSWDLNGISWDFMGCLWDFMGLFSWDLYNEIEGDFDGMSWDIDRSFIEFLAPVRDSSLGYTAIS